MYDGLGILFRVAYTYQDVCPSTDVAMGIICCHKAIMSSGSGKRCSHMLSQRVRVPEDLLDMWAMCLLVVTCFSSALCTYVNTNADCWPAHVCTYSWGSVIYVHCHSLLLTFKCCTHCILLRSCCLAVWCLVSFYSLWVKKPMTESYFLSWRAACLKPRNLLFHVQCYEEKNGKRQSKKCVIRG